MTLIWNPSLTSLLLKMVTLQTPQFLEPLLAPKCLPILLVIVISYDWSFKPTTRCQDVVLTSLITVSLFFPYTIFLQSRARKDHAYQLCCYIDKETWISNIHNYAMDGHLVLNFQPCFTPYCVISLCERPDIKEVCISNTIFVSANLLAYFFKSYMHNLRSICHILCSVIAMKK